ncbi:MAG: bifunctional oligoribonuclease/PAP phosphatase NrnA [Lachnospiraceae bacterium]|nr:bifunctional oligoribonuclease/PAP phosphatase NrnA [Lachnospiraceae bacterium]
MYHLVNYLKKVSTVAITGHVNPDGDCIGSCMGVWLYLRDNFPNILADVYLQPVQEMFSYIEGLEQIHTECDTEKKYDLLILLDIGSKKRIGVPGPYLETAAKTLCFDHHITNQEQYTWLYNDPEASSTSEVVWKFLQEDKISRACAEALYTGIVHDTGVFQYSCTSPRTMRIAARLMEKGIPFSEIVNESFYQKTYAQKQIMGRTLMKSIMFLDGKCIVGVVRQREMKFYGLHPWDMNGIIDQLRNIIGVEVAIFLCETEFQIFKVSLRSKEKVDVSKIAMVFGGGGHKKAAGCTLQGKTNDVVHNIRFYVEKQLKE